MYGSFHFRRRTKCINVPETCFPLGGRRIWKTFLDALAVICNYLHFSGILSICLWFFALFELSNQFLGEFSRSIRPASQFFYPRTNARSDDIPILNNIPAAIDGANESGVFIRAEARAQRIKHKGISLTFQNTRLG